MLKKSLQFAIVIFFLNSVSYANETSQKLYNVINNILENKTQNMEMVSKASQNKILSQMIAKDVVLLVAKVSPKYYYNELLESTKKFNENLNYIKKQKLNAESQKDFNDTQKVWLEFVDNIKHIYNKGKIDKKRYQYILDNNEKLLRLSHKLMQSLQSQNTLNLTGSKVEEHTLKFADRERMLTQKMFKEKFLIFIKKDEARNRIRLRGSYILFENTLKALLHGDKKRGIIPVTNRSLREKIEEMKKVWDKTKAYYSKYDVDAKDMLELIKSERKLYKLSDEIVNKIEHSTEIY
jgi:hypothetical protein